MLNSRSLNYAPNASHRSRWCQLFTLPRLLLPTFILSILSSGYATAQSTVRNVPFSTPFYTYTVQSDIVYGQGEVDGGGSFIDLELDLYIPDVPTPVNANNTLPLMLMIHGGGFYNGSKTNGIILNNASQYAERGWLVASMNYRLVGDNPVPSSRLQTLYTLAGGINAPEQVRAAISAADDTLTALDFLQARSDVDDAWTTLWGSSAGAFTSLITAYCLDDFGIDRPPVALVVDLAGSLGGCYIGNPFDDPTGSDPALMVIHGTNDGTVPYSDALTLQDFAIAAGLPLDFQSVVNGGHVPGLGNNTATTGVTLYQRTVDYHHETVFDGLEQGPQPQIPPGC
ncbi:MAG: prolyl oligopeptidase family serine peptidase [Halioglobus sp.]|nr:prolyl oligopeptidase family serine peptidase [Halioglobus sp.]